MKLAVSLLTFTACLLNGVLSLPTDLVKRAPPTGDDPAFVTPQATLDANIHCPLQPGGSYVNVTNPIFLVPGTGTTGSMSWDHTYVPLTSKLGYQPW